MIYKLLKMLLNLVCKYFVKYFCVFVHHFKESGLYRLIYLNTQSAVGGAVWEG